MYKKTDYLLVFLITALGNCLILDKAFSEENHHSSHAHVHGKADATIVMIGASIEIDLISPAHNLTGFEYKAITPVEIAKIKETDSMLSEPSKMFHFTEAECNFSDVSVDTDSLLKDEDSHHNHDHSHSHHGSQENKMNTHSNFKAKYRILCESGLRPKSIEFLLFKHFENLDRINVKWISEDKQGSKLLTAKDSTIGF